MYKIQLFLPQSNECLPFCKSKMNGIRPMEFLVFHCHQLCVVITFFGWISYFHQPYFLTEKFYWCHCLLVLILSGEWKKRGHKLLSLCSYVAFNMYTPAWCHLCCERRVGWEISETSGKNRCPLQPKQINVFGVL